MMDYTMEHRMDYTMEHRMDYTMEHRMDYTMEHYDYAMVNRMDRHNWYTIATDCNQMYPIRIQLYPVFPIGTEFEHNGPN